MAATRRRSRWVAQWSKPSRRTPLQTSAGRASRYGSAQGRACARCTARMRARSAPDAASAARGRGSGRRTRRPSGHHAVHATRDADGQALHSARQRELVGRLDDQVRVVALDGVVRDARTELDAHTPKGAQHAIERPTTAQARDAGAHLHRHEHGLAARERGARAMGHARLLAARRSSCAGARSAVCSKREVQLLNASSSLHASIDDGTARRLTESAKKKPTES